MPPKLLQVLLKIEKKPVHPTNMQLTSESLMTNDAFGCGYSIAVLCSRTHPFDGELIPENILRYRRTKQGLLYKYRYCRDDNEPIDDGTVPYIL